MADEPLTYKQLVLGVYPEGTCLEMADNYFSDGARYEVLNFDPNTPQNEGLRPKLIGIGSTADEAWKDAYNHLSPSDQAIANKGVWTLTVEEQAKWADKLPLLQLDQFIAEKRKKKTAKKKVARKTK
jgi:hypothetical protein